MALALAALLASCAQVTPNLDDLTATLVVHASPSDAEVAVLPAGRLLEEQVLEPEGLVRSLRFAVAPGRHTVRITAPGHAPVESVVEVAQGEEAEVEVALEPDLNAPSDPAEPGGEPDPTTDPEPTPEPDAGADFSLRGDPSFDPSSLSGDVRRWYERTWAAIENPDQNPDYLAKSKSGDAYQYARNLFSYNQSLLIGLRATGDLRFLDEVDRIAQNLRRDLYDGWCDGYTTEKYNYPEEDGYLNFRRTYDKNDTYCRDVASLEETLLHGHLAAVMYAYHVNRDLESPAGIDYGERADFWLDYLQNHFEAKWRERENVEFPRMDFIDLRFSHTYTRMILYYYYVGMRLESDGDPKAGAYLSHARKLTDTLLETPYDPNDDAGGFMDVQTPMGEAIVYTFGAPGRTGSTSEQSCPTTYARYVIGSALELRLEGFYRWDDELMKKMAVNLAYYVMDTSDVTSRDEPFAAGVTGNKTVHGIEPTTYRGRLDNDKYSLSAFAGLAGWDASGKVERISLDVYRDVESDVNNPRRILIPSLMLLTEARR